MQGFQAPGSGRNVKTWTLENQPNGQLSNLIWKDELWSFEAFGGLVGRSSSNSSSMIMIVLTVTVTITTAIPVIVIGMIINIIIVSVMTVVIVDSESGDLTFRLKARPR